MKARIYRLPKLTTEAISAAILKFIATTGETPRTIYVSSRLEGSIQVEGCAIRREPYLFNPMEIGISGESAS